MPQQYRYTGQNALISFNTGSQNVVLSNDYTELQIEVSTRLEDKTAGNDTDQSFNATIKEGKASLKILDTAENGVTILQILREQVTGYLQVWAKGNIAGKPKFTMPVVVKTIKFDLKNEKNSAIDLEFAKNGPMVDPLGTLQ